MEPTDLKQYMSIHFLSAILSHEGAAHPDVTYTKENGGRYLSVIQKDCIRALDYANTMIEMMK